MGQNSAFSRQPSGLAWQAEMLAILVHCRGRQRFGAVGQL